MRLRSCCPGLNPKQKTFASLFSVLICTVMHCQKDGDKQNEAGKGPNFNQLGYDRCVKFNNVQLPIRYRCLTLKYKLQLCTLTKFLQYFHLVPDILLSR